jgi:hypothetical protein
MGKPKITDLDSSLQALIRSNVIAVSSEPVMVANTLTETTTYSGTIIPANTMGTDGGLKITIDFDESHSVVATTSIRLKLGGTTVINVPYAEGATDTLKPSRIVVTGINLGSASSQRWFSTIMYQDGVGKMRMAYGSSSVNTAADQELTVTVQHDVANANVYYQQYHVIIEKV